MYANTGGGWRTWERVAFAGDIIVPAPPANGTVTLQSVNGVLQWV